MPDFPSIKQTANCTTPRLAKYYAVGWGVGGFRRGDTFVAGDSSRRVNAQQQRQEKLRRAEKAETRNT